MPNIEIKADKICLKDSQSEPQVESFVLTTEDQSGVVFGLISIDERSNNFHLIINEVKDGLQNLSKSLNTKTNLQHHFEKALQNINEKLYSLYEKHLVDIDPAAINVIVGAAQDKSIVITGAGEMVTTFLHKTEKQRFRIFDLFSGIRAEAVIPEKDKILSVVLDGQLTSSDVLLVSNKPLFRHIQTDDLNQIISTLPPKSAIEKIKQYLPEVTNVGILIVKAVKPTTSGTKIKPIKPGVSIEALAETRHQTEEILDTQKPKMKNIMGAVTRMFKKDSEGKKNTFKKEKVFRIITRVLKVVIGAVLITATFVLNVGKSGLKFLWSFFRSKEERVKAKQDLKNSWKNAVDNMANRFNLLPRTSKYLIILAMLVALIFVNSLYFIGRGKQQAQQEETFSATIEIIHQKQDAAEASLIYDDESQARMLLLQAQGLLNTLPQDSEERIATIEAVNQEIEVALQELRHMTVIQDPVLLGEFNSEDSNRGRNLSVVNGSVYVFSNNNEVFTVDSSAKTLNSIDSTGNPDGELKNSTTEDGVIYFTNMGSKFSYFETESDTFDELEVITSGTEGNPADLAIYNNKLYLLSPGRNQIFRHNSVSGGFSSGTPWVNGGVDLSNASSVTIDGFIYVLKSSGEVLQFLSGDLQNWTIDSVDPVMQTPTLIRTTTDSDFLYILDPAEKRLIVFNKNGQLVIQFYSDKFTDLKDFYVDEADKKIYVLTETTVYGIAASHLQ